MTQDGTPPDPQSPPADQTPAAPPARERSEEAALLAVLPCACFVLDREWRFTYVNPSAERLLADLADRPAGSLLGRNIWEECPELGDSAFSRQCKQALAQQSAVEAEAYYPAIERWFAIDACPRGDRLCVFLQDVTERTRLVRELRRRGQGLREADRGKDAFLLQLAHVVRNALASIRNALHLVGSHPLSREDRKACALAGEEVRGLSRLMDDLLRVSELTQTVPNKQRINLSNVVAQSLRAALASPGAGGRSFNVHVPAEPLWLDADPEQLEQALGHLLDNAVKFTPPGGTVRLTAEREGVEVVLRVSDDGAGLAPDVLPHVFNLFMRPDSGPDPGLTLAGPGSAGLGIGLTLVRRVAELHGGEVEAHSDGPGHGSEFVVRLPAPEAPRDLLPDSQPFGEGRRAPRVLVVDDNMDAAQSLALVLESWGCEVHLAYDGPGALETAAACRPEVVLLDIKMPRMDGYQVAEQLRRNEDGDGLTLVAMTGCGQDEDRDRALQAGFDYFMVKPVDPGDLKDLLTFRETNGEPAG
jgi:two-component system CheB/CheR fusion protein